MKYFLVFAHFFVSTSQKKVFSRPLSSAELLVYTPKEARGRIFVTGGSFFARQMVAKK